MSCFSDCLSHFWILKCRIPSLGALFINLERGYRFQSLDVNLRSGSVHVEDLASRYFLFFRISNIFLEFVGRYINQGKL